jgi:hypothetical protein
MEKINFDKRTLKKFGIMMACAFLIITSLMLIKGKHLNFVAPLISLLFFVLASIKPFILKPVYFLWMKLAFALGWINTRLILVIVFYLIFTPIGLLLRLFGYDPLDLKIEKNRASYWKKKEAKGLEPVDYQRQF